MILSISWFPMARTGCHIGTPKTGANSKKAASRMTKTTTKKADAKARYFAGPLVFRRMVDTKFDSSVAGVKTRISWLLKKAFIDRLARPPRDMTRLLSTRLVI